MEVARGGEGGDTSVEHIKAQPKGKCPSMWKWLGVGRVYTSVEHIKAQPKGKCPLVQSTCTGVKLVSLFHMVLAAVPIITCASYLAPIQSPPALKLAESPAS